MNKAFVCWSCGQSIEEHPLPLSRTAECQNCHADLYVCKMCEFYDTRVSKSCRETIADEISNKERASFCGYLVVKPDAFTALENMTEIKTAQQQLADLFGDSNQASNDNSDKTDSPLSKNEAAKAELEKLFKNKDT